MMAERQITVQEEISGSYHVITTRDGVTGEDGDGQQYHLEPRHRKIGEGGTYTMVARPGDRLWLDEDGGRYWVA